MTHDEFLALSPERLHGLNPLHEAVRRPLTWFCHSRQRLFTICRKLGCEFSENQQMTRRHIGQVLFDRFPLFQRFVEEARILSGKAVGLLLSQIIGCLQFSGPRVRLG